MMANTPRIASRLARFILLTPNSTSLAAFYRQAFGCQIHHSERIPATHLLHLAIDGGAAATSLLLGQQSIDLIQCDRPGRLISTDARSSDLAFQHFAIVVSDMREAYRKLCAEPGWRAISVDGPQRLPASSGGVTAFKFRDPDGHPLELLAFPNDHMPAHWRHASVVECCVGIDHSAIGVSDAAKSVAFYETIGLAVVSRSYNTGPEQARLDDIHEPQVDVIAVAPEHDTPHLELLAYRDGPRRFAAMPGANDVAATQLVFETDDERASSRGMIDPDGHRILIEPRSRSRP